MSAHRVKGRRLSPNVTAALLATSRLREQAAVTDRPERPSQFFTALAAANDALAAANDRVATLTELRTENLCLRVENAHLTAERDRYRGKYDHACDERDAALATVDELLGDENLR